MESNPGWFSHYFEEDDMSWYTFAVANLVKPDLFLLTQISTLGNTNLRWLELRYMDPEWVVAYFFGAAFALPIMQINSIIVFNFFWWAYSLQWFIDITNWFIFGGIDQNAG